MFEKLKDKETKKRIGLYLDIELYEMFKQRIAEINKSYPQYSNIPISKFTNVAIAELMENTLNNPENINQLLYKYNYLHLKPSATLTKGDAE